MYVAAAVSNEGDFGNSPGGGLFYGDPAWRSSSPELDGSGLFANELCNAVSDVTPRDAVHYTEGYRFHNRSTRGLFIKEIHLYAVPLTKPKTSTSDPLWVTLTLMKAYSRLILVRYTCSLVTYSSVIAISFFMSNCGFVCAILSSKRRFMCPLNQN
ncbi:hypothetical protein ACET3Z_001856 [Daucus carota]